MSFVERLHPRDGDGKFAREPGSGGGGMRVVSRTRNGPTVVQHRPEQRPGPAGPAGAARGGDGWASAGPNRVVATIGGSEYHLKRAGGKWSVFVGDPQGNQRVAVEQGLPAAKAAAHAHAQANSHAPVTPPPVVTPPVRPRRESVATSTRAPRVSPTTARLIHDTRAALPATTRDGWHEAAKAPVSVQARRKLAEDADRLAKQHQRNVTKLNKIKADYITATVAAMKTERDRGYHTRYDGAGNEVPIGDEEIERRVGESALSQPKYLAQQRIAVASLGASMSAKMDLEDAEAGDTLPTDAGTRLLMPSPKLNAALDSTLAVGRAFLADARKEFDRTAPAVLARAQQTLRRIDTYTAPIDAADKAYTALKAGRGPVEVALPDGSATTLSTAREARDLEERLRDERYAARNEARPFQRRVLAHQQSVLLAMLADQRPVGGVHHEHATAKRDTGAWAGQMQPRDPRTDWQQRLSAAEAFFPDTWLARHAGQPLTVGASDRAYYIPENNHISFSTATRDQDRYDGGFADKTAEIAVHELGHRMEQYVPGLTAMEFAFVRRHATGPDGTVEPVQALPGYDDTERGQKDDWGRPYAGKSYEFSGEGRGPHERAWEVFQVGLQDTFGRSSERYGRTADPEELQAFVIGALLTL